MEANLLFQSLIWFTVLHFSHWPNGRVVWKLTKCKLGIWRDPTASRGKRGLWILLQRKKDSLIGNDLLWLGIYLFLLYFYLLLSNLFLLILASTFSWENLCVCKYVWFCWEIGCISVFFWVILASTLFSFFIILLKETTKQNTYTIIFKTKLVFDETRLQILASTLFLLILAPAFELQKFVCMCEYVWFCWEIGHPSWKNHIYNFF